MNDKKYAPPGTINRSDDVNKILVSMERELTEEVWKQEKESDGCADGSHHVSIDDLGFPQCEYCHLTFDNWLAVKLELEKKYHESGATFVEDRLSQLKNLSTKVKRGFPRVHSTEVSYFRPDPIRRGYQFISRIFYILGDKISKK